jgi:hypothetical protein
MLSRAAQPKIPEMHDSRRTTMIDPIYQGWREAAAMLLPRARRLLRAKPATT